MSSEAESATDVPVAERSTRSIDLESVRAIARKDFRDAVRSWLFWGLSVFFFALLVTLTGVISYFGGDVILAEGATTEVLVGQVYGVGSLIIPVIALVLGWKAIAGERESGSIKIMLSLPHSRRDVVLGKLVGRAGVLSLSLLVGFVLAAVPVAVLLGTFDPTDYVGLLAVSILYGIVYTSVAIAVSSVTRSTTFAAAGAFGVFVLFYVVWGTIATAVGFLMAFDYLPESETIAELTMLFQNLNPNAAYGNVLSLVTSAAELGEQEVAALETMFDGSIPFYLQDWFALLILLAWIVIPVALAIYRFDRTDL
ncbi:ABC transporter permease [Natronobacterium gregoryi]|uniref:ABC transporter n=2 Tax=Natronobacterium gregoryi TaxID=44930 RepID=L0AIB5_NATGS|nr:ABC transporter permease [Natronobacterium gregoryi]AFZ72917.1 ABC-type transport system involved in multi-copper enzyme maturation, permease component [Natronobacterium gregoryi SP2]ELY69787.1 ABC transporter [Natronobacterium gregoryi SP2]PLK21855.1 ABC transporter [Natronobacterium gregoryi SP2]SFI67258.1 ABC-2 type transport system permease protein [Natronobacterium gregoryi]